MVTVPHRMVRLERMLDYRGFGLQGFYSTVEPLYSTTSIYDDNHMQWKKKNVPMANMAIASGSPCFVWGSRSPPFQFKGSLRVPPALDIAHVGHVQDPL